jgi:hypothetical protein
MFFPSQWRNTNFLFEQKNFNWRYSDSCSYATPFSVFLSFRNSLTFQNRQFKNIGPLFRKIDCVFLMIWNTFMEFNVLLFPMKYFIKIALQKV